MQGLSKPPHHGGQKLKHLRPPSFLYRILRSSSAVEQWAHNPKVNGANPFSASSGLQHGQYDVKALHTRSLKAARTVKGCSTRILG